MNSALFLRRTTSVIPRNVLRSTSVLSSVVQQRRNYGVNEFLDQSKDPAGRAVYVGRAWRSSELRLKSFEDLHKLWFVLLKERNMLLSERERARSKKETMEKPERLKKVRLSMARLKTIVDERSKIHKRLLAYKNQHLTDNQSE